ncbi:hypothetical protein ACFOGJ_16210 [Marinibaculum pumilum]|uniref:Uncharacterized protein n=1 Tax=Marinibaculum pumilum TaxID=1766165 RepID=A0ABV7L2Z3_9PROT
MSLLTIVQNTCDALGLSRPTAIISSTDAQVRQMLSLSNRGAKLLARQHDWAVLTKEHTFTTANADADYAFPSDYDRIAMHTAWDRSNYWEIREAIPGFIWQALKSGIVVPPGLRKSYRIKAVSNARQLFIDPTPTATETLVYEYFSNGWNQTSGGTAQAAWANDTDTALLDEELLTFDLVWRFRQAQGLGGWEEDYQMCRNYLELLKAQDKGAAVLSANGMDWHLGQANIQDGSYPSS